MSRPVELPGPIVAVLPSEPGWRFLTVRPEGTREVSPLLAWIVRQDEEDGFAVARPLVLEHDGVFCLEVGERWTGEHAAVMPGEDLDAVERELNGIYDPPAPVRDPDVLERALVWVLETVAAGELSWDDEDEPDPVDDSYPFPPLVPAGMPAELAHAVEAALIRHRGEASS